MISKSYGSGIAALAFATWVVASTAGALDGSSAPPPPEGGGESATAPEVAVTYYEQVTGGSVVGLETSYGGMPGSLATVEGAGGVAYQLVSAGQTASEWRVSMELSERPHERVDAVYDLVLALPLPVDAAGESAFDALQFGIEVGDGSPAGRLVYAGDPVVLKRNVALERSWLPLLEGVAGGLPDLAGSGYAFTLWDVILRYDPGHGSTVQGTASLRYQTAAGVSAPDPDDGRNAAYVITWIPTLDPSVPPFTVRLDVVNAVSE